MEERGSTEIRLREDGFWIGYINNQLENQEDINEVLQEDQALNKVTRETIQYWAQVCLKGDNYVRLALMPEISMPSVNR